MTTNPSTSDGQIKLAIDLLASAMLGTVPPNWWGYGMPPELTAKSPGTSQVADVTGKAPMVWGYKPLYPYGWTWARRLGPLRDESKA